MIGRLMRRERKMPIEARLDALEAAIDVKLRALLATATQAILGKPPGAAAAVSC